MTKVSVIIPVYNAEKYLGKCLESLLSQTLQEMEIICVDDGSSDGSPEILKRFQGRDERVRILTQENQYAGVARNNGMREARGEYLLFLDADDFLKKPFLKKRIFRVKKRTRILFCSVQSSIMRKRAAFQRRPGTLKETRFLRRILSGKRRIQMFCSCNAGSLDEAFQERVRGSAGTFFSGASEQQRCVFCADGACSRRENYVCG